MGELFTWQLALAALVVLALLMAANEFGFRVGRSHKTDEPEPERAVANAIKGSVVGLVAFLLGFAFSICFNRHDQRRQVVIDEANALGTLHLRAGLLPDPERTALRTALCRYLDARLAYFTDNPSGESSPATLRQMDALLAEVWAAVEAAHARNPQAVLVSQTIPAANEVIDLNATRGWAFRGQTPGAVLFVLLVSVLVSAGLIGHSFGQNRRRHTFICLLFNILFTLILYLILDFDGPRYGLIQLDHSPLVELRNGLRPPE